ncbi:Type III pantothenate kinase [termite gut metagenome]|uniref:Type III pantothenate kinase n=1 Tax=termite gut metagenome TaxID=433724 RepID=A0A5J4SZ30_9ZZZZ
MNLTIDIGNTITKVAVFDKNELTEIFYAQNGSLDNLSEICDKYCIENGIVATVKDIEANARKQIEKCLFPILWLTHETKLPVVNLYKTPETLGYDRIAAVVGANDMFPEKNILVIDAGTAITYEFIDAENQYHGGNISPGLQMRFKALHHYTGRLPLIQRDGEVALVSKNTETAIRSGVVKGIEYEIMGYISAFKEMYPDLLIFLTGGDSFSFDTRLKNIIFADKFLVLKGLNRILNYNNGNQAINGCVDTHSFTGDSRGAK